MTAVADQKVTNFINATNGHLNGHFGGVLKANQHTHQAKSFMQASPLPASSLTTSTQKTSHCESPTQQSDIDMVIFWQNQTMSCSPSICHGFLHCGCGVSYNLDLQLLNSGPCYSLSGIHRNMACSPLLICCTWVIKWPGLKTSLGLPDCPFKSFLTLSISLHFTSLRKYQQFLFSSSGMSWPR